MTTEIKSPKAMTWAARLKRAFNIDIKKCEVCEGPVKVIACIDNPAVIKKILDHVNSEQGNQFKLPENRAPPMSLMH